MSATYTRNYTRLAVAIIIAAIVISASALSYSSFEATVTRTVATGTTTTSTQVSTSTITDTVTSTSTAFCAVLASNATDDLTTDCSPGITLGLTTAHLILVGQNATVFLSLANDLTASRNVTYTGFPALPDGLELGTSTSLDDILPVDNYCGLPSVPVFIAVYNESGALMQLSDASPNITSLPCSPPSYQSFNASQTTTETFSVGGYWSSPDAGEPWINATYSQFDAGQYTIVAFDPWQQLAEVNFTVANNISSPGQVAVVIPPGTTSNPDPNFNPANFTVVIGVNNTVVFTNENTIAATVESTSWPTNGTGFAGLVNPGQSWTVHLTVPGVYNYNNEWRPVWMKGTIIVEPLPLQLEVTLNATAIQTGGGILAKISIANPLGVNVTVPANYENDSTILSWNTHDFLCGGAAASNPTWSLAGYALFQGHYSSANVSSAAIPLSLEAPLIIECPAFPSPSEVVYYPHGSDTVAYFPQPNNFHENATTGVAEMNASTGVCVLTSGYYNCNGTALSGYWTGPPGGYFNSENANTTSPYFHYFPPGQYTLVVEDAWGQTYYAYFQVASE